VRENLRRAARGRHAAVTVVVLCWTAAGLVSGARDAGPKDPPVATKGSDSTPTIGRGPLPGTLLHTTGIRPAAAGLVPVPSLRWQ
jgi:hypothetical protein